MAADPAVNTRSCVAVVKQVANAAEKRSRTQRTKPSKAVQKLTKKVAQIEEEVYQSLIEMDKETKKNVKVLATDHAHRPKGKKSMAHLGSKRVWKTCARRWWTHQGYKHCQVH